MPTRDTLQNKDDGRSNEIDGVSAEKSLRVDARRNRERVLEVATQAFATNGMEIPIDEIAQRAGVGVGTVYRHFPTKDALYEAVIVSYKQSLIEKARDMLNQDDPGSAFYGFLSQIVREGLNNKGLVDAIARSGVDIYMSSRISHWSFVLHLENFFPVRSVMAQCALTLRPPMLSLSYPA